MCTFNWILEAIHVFEKKDDKRTKGQHTFSTFKEMKIFVNQVRSH